MTLWFVYVCVCVCLSSGELADSRACWSPDGFFHKTRSFVPPFIFPALAAPDVATREPCRHRIAVVIRETELRKPSRTFREGWEEKPRTDLMDRRRTRRG